MIACRARVTLGLCCVIGLVGCGGLKVVPVSGKATVGGKPLAGFSVTFIPEATKGPEARVDCSARIGGDGNYSLRTDDGSKLYQGAPPGKYKVTIFSPDDKPLPVHPKYTNINDTPLVIEVTASPKPGAYDLKFEK